MTATGVLNGKPAEDVLQISPSAPVRWWPGARRRVVRRCSARLLVAAALIVGAAASAEAQGQAGMPVSILRGGLMTFALRESVREELGIAADAPEVAALKKLAEAYDAELLQATRDAKDPDKRYKIGPTLMEKFDPELQKLLQPEQFQRLKQIFWQYSGPMVFDYPEVVRALDIRLDQQANLAALQLQDFKDRVRFLNPANGERPTPAERERHMRASRVEWDRKVIDILDTPQRAKFAELKGKPFDLELLDGRPKAK